MRGQYFEGLLAVAEASTVEKLDPYSDKQKQFIPNIMLEEKQSV